MSKLKKSMRTKLAIWTTHENSQKMKGCVFRGKRSC